MLVSDLLQALKTVNPAISHNGIVPEYGGFRFNNNSVSACDGQFVITKELKLPDGFKAIIPSNPFFDIVKSLPMTKEVNLSLSDGKVNVKCGKTNIDFTLVNSENYICAKNFERSSDSFTDFVSAVKQCFPLLCRDASKPYHNMYIKNEWIYACDLHRCIRAEAKVNLNSFIIPNRMAKMISEAEAIHGYDSDGKTFTVLFDGGVRATIALPIRENDKFDVLEGMFYESNEEGVVSFKFNKCDDIFKRHAILQSGLDLGVMDSELNFVDTEKCVITSVNSNCGKVEDEIELSMPIDSPFKVYVNPKFLSGFIDDSSYVCIKDEVLQLLSPNFQYVFKVKNQL